MDQYPSVCMVGLGYIGLPTAALMAGKGIHVTGVDINPDVVDTINAGKIHIVEPDLEGLVHYAVKEKLLVARTRPVPADVYLIAVPTPFKNDHHPDISYVEDAVKSVVPMMQPGSLMIIESTSPVGTTDQMAALIYEMRPELKGKISLAYCPERVLPGKVIYELEQNDRVIGGHDSSSTEMACEFYARFVKGKLWQTNARTAEMCKLVENASRDVNIAFANELSLICDEAGIDVYELIQLANRHPRVNILTPGPGVGGHCIAVDPWFIASEFPEKAKIIRLSREVNRYKTDWVVEKITNEALRFEKENSRAPVIACLGLAFKPDIDDLRESPALEIAHKINSSEFRVLAVEPNIDKLPGFELVTPEEALQQADIVALLVAHKEFKSLPDKAQYLNFCGV